jgi:hypothetical protein
MLTRYALTWPLREAGFRARFILRDGGADALDIPVVQSAKQGLLLTGFLEWASPRVQRIMIFRRVFFSLSAPPWLYQMEQCLSSFGCPGITGARVVWSLARQATEMSRYPVA